MYYVCMYLPMFFKTMQNILKYRNGPVSEIAAIVSVNLQLYKLNVYLLALKISNNENIIKACL
jgi:hypothetical protein